MTRGFVAVINGKNVEKVGYLISDAYLSWYGLKILNEIRKGKESFDKWMDDLHKDNITHYGEADDPCKGFELNWIKPDKVSREDKDWRYIEYGYIYDSKNSTLAVYYDGTKLFRFSTKDDSEVKKYLYLFENDNRIYEGISYDKDLLTDAIPYRKCMKMAGENSLELLEHYVAKANVERLYLDDDHLIAPGHSTEYPAYQKKLRSSENSLRYLTFIVEKSNLDNKWDVLLQTPFVRITVSDGHTSEKAAVRAIRTLIKTEGKISLMRLAEVFQNYADAHQAKNNLHEERVFVESLEDMWKTQPWYIIRTFTYGGEAYLTPKWFKRQLLRHIA